MPAMAEIRRQGRPTDTTALDNPSWDEDSVTRWRALALFSGVTVGGGLFLVGAKEARPFIDLGVLLFLAAGVFDTAGGE